MKKLLFSVIALFWGLSVLLSQDLIQSTYDTDSDEWTTVGGIMYYRDQGGNPGGFIEFEDNEDGAGSFVAPGKFLGDLTGFNLGTLSFDLINTNDNGMDSLYNYGNVTISSPAINASKNVVPLLYYSEWTTFTIPLTAEEWGLTPSGWDSLLSDVTAITIQADAQWNYYDRSGIDNFTLIPVDFGIASGALTGRQSESISYAVNPNPAKDFTTIRFTLNSFARVTIQVYDLAGRLTVSLLNETMPAGPHEVRLSTDGLRPGVYFSRITANGTRDDQKIMVLRK